MPRAFASLISPSRCKSCPATAFSACRRSSTLESAHARYSGEVCTVRRIASRLGNGFSPADTMMTIIARSISVGTGCAYEDSSSCPAFHSTSPPYMERQEEPDPRLASRDRSRADSRSPAACEEAVASAANAEAELASPAPNGTVLCDSTRAGRLMPAIARTMSRNRETRSNALPARRLPSMARVSGRRGRAESGDSRNSTVVRVLNPSNVSERLDVRGMINRSSALPQYLISAIFACAVAVTVPTTRSASCSGAPSKGAPLPSSPPSTATTISVQLHFRFGTTAVQPWRL